MRTENDDEVKYSSDFLNLGILEILLTETGRFREWAGLETKGNEFGLEYAEFGMQSMTQDQAQGRDKGLGSKSGSHLHRGPYIATGI